MFDFATCGRRALAMALVLPMAGCASVSPEGAFLEVADSVQERSGKRISWQGGPYVDPEAHAAVRYLLSRPLTARAAIQIALLNNRGLQATYAKLGIAQADLVQSVQLPNPAVDGAIKFTEAGITNLAFAGTIRVAEILFIRVRKRVAESELAAAKLKVTGEVLAVAGETHTSYLDYLAQRQLIGLFSQVLKSTRASVGAARSLREAGNISAMELETQNAELIQSKLSLAKAETSAASAREKLNVLMGLTGMATQWRAPKRLPDVPGSELRTVDVEARAIAESLELAVARQKLITLAKKYRLTKATALLPDLDVGGEWERNEGEEESGPVFGIQLPILDWGRARKARARMEIAQARDEYTALAVKIRSTARLARLELLTARKTAGYYQKSVLPQIGRLVTENQRQYNAMQLGVFRLIQAKRRQIQAGQQYVQALSAYWKARAHFGQLMRGKLPGEGGGGGEMAVAATSGGAAGAH